MRDQSTGEVCGGLLGRTGRGALHITELWVAEAHRRRRHRSALLVRAEEEANARGCRLAFVETYSFHAPAFYEQHGYAIFGRLSGFSGGHTRFYLRKDLGAGPGEGQQLAPTDPWYRSGGGRRAPALTVSAVGRS